MAVELVRERLLNGSSSGYYFLFAEQEIERLAIPVLANCVYRGKL